MSVLVERAQSQAAAYRASGIDDLLLAVIATPLGSVELSLKETIAPFTARYFVDAVESGYYKRGAIYRSTRLGVPDGPFLLQGGGALATLRGDRPDRAIPEMLETLEGTDLTGLRHQRGTLSLARDLGRSGHVLPEFFICLGDFPSLDAGGRSLHDDRGFPAFGEVSSGIELLDALARSECGGHSSHPRLVGEMLSEPLVIHHLRGVE